MSQTSYEACYKIICCLFEIQIYLRNPAASGDDSRRVESLKFLFILLCAYHQDVSHINSIFSFNKNHIWSQAFWISARGGARKLHICFKRIPNDSYSKRNFRNPMAWPVLQRHKCAYRDLSVLLKFGIWCWRPGVAPEILHSKMLQNDAEAIGCEPHF